MTRRKLCVVTGTRAEYGLLRGLIAGIAGEPGLELQLVVTGSHLAADFGSTVGEIEADGFPIARRIDILLASDTPAGVAKSAGLGLIGFGEAFAELVPDIVVLLGDRYEMLAAATAALIGRFPVAHLHGGEITEGSIDDAMRHAITKMAALHFVAAAPYRDRVIRMGEAPDRVFVVGGLGVDALARTRFADRAEVEAALGVALGPRNLLVTFHPATAEADDAARQCEEMLAALADGTDARLVFTLANADAGGRAINARLHAFAARHQERSVVVASLSSRLYLSCLRLVEGVVGNSSSGLLEAPSLAVGTVNIGDRQKGRLRAASVIDCRAERTAIRRALALLYEPAFRGRLPGVRNPYGEGGATARILQVLGEVPLAGLARKSFHEPGPGPG